MKLFLTLFAMGMTMLFGLFAFADSAVLAPQDFLAQVLQAIQSFGGLSMMMKISTVILLVVASMKVSFLNQLVWSKLGSYQALVGPVLGLIAGILGLGNGGASITLASVLAYVAAGGGAIVLHELLDMVKAIPGLGAMYVSAIELIESMLGAKPSV